MCRVNTCCCGCTLKTGAIVCAVFTGIAAIYSIYSGYTATVIIKLIDDGDKTIINAFKEAGFEIDNVITLYKTTAGINFLTAILLITAFIGIVVGISQEKAIGVMIWLVVEMIQIVLSGISIIVCFILGVIALGIVALIGIGINIYLWIVVYSYYHELKDGEGALGALKGIA